MFGFLSEHRFALAWRNTIVALVFLTWLRCPAGAAEPMAAPRIPTIAIIDDGTTTITPLLEADLLATDFATWVERSQLQKILAEQKLQQMFGAEAVGNRSRLGKLLKCDLLVLLHTRSHSAAESNTDVGAPRPAVIECTISETKHGLRLLTTQIPKSRPAEVNVRDLAQAVRSGVQKWQQDVVQVFAVPPLVSKDLDFRWNYLQSAYAQLLQQQLLDIPGTLVVELAEAQAIGRELAVAGQEDKVDRNWVPFYIHGEFRHDDTAQRPNVKFKLRLEQEGRVLRSGDSPTLTTTAAPEWLQRATAALVKTAGRAEPVARNSQQEAKQLAARADEFMLIGQWKEALALLEASLLLVPDSLRTRQSAVICCGHVRDEYFNKRVPLHEYLPVFQQSMSAFARGIEHLELYLDGTPELPSERAAGGNFVTDFDNGFWSSIRVSHNAPEQAQELARQTQVLRTETYLRIGLRRAKQKSPDRFWFGLIMFMQPLEARLSIIRSVLAELDEAPLLVDVIAAQLQAIDRDFGSKDPQEKDRLAQVPELQRLIAQLENSPAQPQRDVALLTRQLIAEWARNPLVMKHEPALRSDLHAEFQLHPITFHLPDKQPLQDLPLTGLAAGKQCDVYLGRNTIYLMKHPGVLQPVWKEAGPRPSVGMAVYDGKWVWCVVHANQASQRLIVLDPEQGTVVEFKPPQSFPAPPADSNLQTSMHLAPLSPGRVLIAAYMGRSWIGVAQSDSSGVGEFKIVYEARGSEIPDLGAKQSEAAQFKPAGMHVCRTTQGEVQVLITRMSPQVLNLHYKSGLIYRDASQSVHKTDDAFSFDEARGITNNSEQVQYLQFTRVGERVIFNLVGLDCPDFLPREIVTDVPWGKMIWHAGRLHILGEQWWTWNPASRQVRQLQGNIPWFIHSAPSRQRFVGRTIRKPSPYDHYLDRMFVSEHYGLVLVMFSGQMFTAQLPSFSEQ